MRAAKRKTVFLKSLLFSSFISFSCIVFAHHPIINISTNTEGKQDHATLDVDDSGVAVIAWHADDESLQSPNTQTHLVLARLFDSQTGLTISAPFSIDLDAREEQWTPDVEVDHANDRFAISWAGRPISSLEWNTYLRIIDDQGSPILPDSFETKFQINEIPSSKQMFPDIGSYDNGDFVVVWDEVNGSEMNYFLRLESPRIS